MQVVQGTILELIGHIPPLIFDRMAESAAIEDGWQSGAGNLIKRKSSSPRPRSLCRARSQFA